jgi:hypothetical protein
MGSSLEEEGAVPFREALAEFGGPVRHGREIGELARGERRLGGTEESSDVER